jgi:hypothetical protein
MHVEREIGGPAATYACVVLGLAVVVAALVLFGTPALAEDGDTEVTVGSNDNIFSQNKQNEPAVAVDANHPNVLVAGANDEIDEEACNAGDDTTCPFTDGVGVSGVYFSFDSGATWAQPTYTGLTARGCLGEPGDTDPDCEPKVGLIGTLPKYYENGLVSDGDPSVAFGPRRGPDGEFSWANGSRLYYASLASNLPGEQAFKGFEAITVSRTDNVQAAAAGNEAAWKKPVIVSKQNSALFSDKEQVWADNAESSSYFGNVYVCNAAFRSVGGAPEPIIFSRSTDGGNTWTNKQITNAANTNSGQGRSGGRQGCTVRTDSQGTVYVFYEGTLKGSNVQYEVRSFDGGVSFTRPEAVAMVTDVGLYDPATGDYSFDGVGGARTNSFPSVDIANGAPDGQDATDEIVMTWSDGPTPSDEDGGPNEQALVTYSTDHGDSFSEPVNAAPADDRPDFPAIAISPDGTNAYLTYDNFQQPWQSSTLAPPRLMQGVVMHADVAEDGSIGTFSELHRGPSGDARGSSQNNLAAGFLGDYNYAVATRDYGAAVWNDVRNAADCSDIDAYRQELVDAVTEGTAEPREEDLPEVRNEDRDKAEEEEEPTPPAVQQECPANFGNSDIYGGTYADPTP